MLGEERKYRQSHLILFVVSHLSFFLGLYLFPLSRYLLFFFSIVNSVLWGCGFCLILQVLLCPRVCVLVTQSCPTLCGPTDCRLPGFSVRGIFQARILEWVAISYPRGSPRPRDETHISCVPGIGRQILYRCGTWQTLYCSCAKCRSWVILMVWEWFSENRREHWIQIDIC